MPRFTPRRRARLCAGPLLMLAIRAALGASVLAAAPAVTAFAQVPAPPANEQPLAPATPPAGSLEGLPILKVEVVGAVRTDPQLILDQVRAQAGQNYSRAQVDVDMRTIAALDRFLTVTPFVIAQEDPATHVIKGVIVQYKVEERPIIVAVEIRGNRQIGDEKIRDGLLSRVGSSVDSFSIETDRKTILDMYRKKGYAETSVTVDQEALKTNIVRYTITEGPRAKINHIRFDGNDNVSTTLLKFKIQTKTYFWSFRKGVLDEDKLQQDLVTIREVYLKRGYLDARVSYYVEYSPDKSRITLHFAIIEGVRYKIHQINLSFTGDSIFSRDELLGDTSKFGPGSYAERDKIEALQKRIEDRYGHEGYIYRNVEMIPAYTDTPGVIDLNINITAGKPYLVGDVIVRGNPNVQDRVIRRQVRIYPDQTYDTVLVRKSIERLKAVRLFQDVRITPTGDAPDIRNPVVEVAEGQTGRFSIGAGISTNSGLIGQVSLEQQNFDITNPPNSMDEFFHLQSFKGAGQYFRILLEPGTEYQQYRITFEEPYLFDSPYSFSNDIYFFTRSRESWNERRIGDIVTFGRRFGDVWSVSLSFRGEEVDISHPNDLNNNLITDTNYFLTDPTTGQPAGPFSDTAQEILSNQGSKFLTSIKPAIVRDTTDSHIFPTTGSRSALSWEQYGAMSGDIDFAKIVARYDVYFPLYEDLFERKTVLALKNEVGVDVLGHAPFFERFYAGGIGSLRGFRFRGVGPHSGPLDDPVGGDLEWVSTAEVNYPIWENLLRGVVFTDVGTVERDITIGSVRADFGAGLRITIPVFIQAPLALDFAYPMLKQSGDRTQLISFSLGLPF